MTAFLPSPLRLGPSPHAARVALGAALALGLVLGLTLAGAPARAQTTEGAPPPYEGDLLRLSEILGALHYIRPLCGAVEPTRWRDEMAGILNSEHPSDGRRSQLIAAFNRGYESYKQVYRSCTPSAELASQRYLEAGAKLSRDIAARYGSN
ncbi:TIGR02301 family protein [Ancylobacter mangrovi]|uniref:TIGR02301 family protein n=1 Tax=Ancylobacter mangrovi TaxID=2972472 RepID=A0A9X2PDJ6_9HYPH|nr:TIGR02301 family protein [Ancylobacter mangrovi]MCS0494926.1 TIGR02301 family protein [Ancylobacter mangrovi]